MEIVSQLTGPDPEGATPLEHDDLQGLRLGFISSRAQLDAAEFANIADADLWLRRSQKPLDQVLTVKFLRDLHTKMFGNVWKWAGKWRTRTTNIGIDWHQAPSETSKAMSDAAFWHQQQTFAPHELAVRLHHRLVTIHPFPNGNGRVTRAIADHYLDFTDETALSWGSTNLTSNSSTRQQYIEALIEADHTGNYQALLNFARS